MIQKSVREKLEELLSLDGYKDFEDAESIAIAFNELRDIVKSFIDNINTNW
jgi:hypothetical protein